MTNEFEDFIGVTIQETILAEVILAYLEAVIEP